MNLPEKTRHAVYLRDGYVCIRCGSARSLSVHHRQPRGMGGTDRPDVHAMPNLITLCGDGVRGCHGWVESHRTQATALGFLCPSWENPADWPVNLGGDRWEQPGEGWTTAEPLSAQLLHADGEPSTRSYTGRCHCGRPVPESSACGCCCARHDDPAVRTPAPDPSPAEQTVIQRFGIFDEEEGR